MKQATDGTDTIIVADDAIRGESRNKDGSWDFKCIGGPYHDMTFRSYDLSEPLTFDNVPGYGRVVYEICPPAKSGGKWKYIHNPLYGKE